MHRAAERLTVGPVGMATERDADGEPRLLGVIVGQQCECHGVARADDCEVAAVESCDFGEAEPFAQRNDGGICGS